MLRQSLPFAGLRAQRIANPALIWVLSCWPRFWLFLVRLFCFYWDNILSHQMLEVVSHTLLWALHEVFFGGLAFRTSVMVASSFLEEAEAVKFKLHVLVLLLLRFLMPDWSFVFRLFASSFASLLSWWWLALRGIWWFSSTHNGSLENTVVKLAVPAGEHFVVRLTCVCLGTRERIEVISGAHATFLDHYVRRW